MLITEEQRFNYFTSWDLKTLRDCQVLLEQFKCCDRLVQHISDYIAVLNKPVPMDVGGMTRMEKELKKVDEETRECAYCKKGTVFVFSLPNCEQARTGRFRYEECDQCDFWSEVFIHGTQIHVYERGKLKEVR